MMHPDAEQKIQYKFGTTIPLTGECTRVLGKDEIIRLEEITNKRLEEQPVGTYFGKDRPFADNGNIAPPTEDRDTPMAIVLVSSIFDNNQSET